MSSFVEICAVCCAFVLAVNCGKSRDQKRGHDEVGAMEEFSESE